MSVEKRHTLSKEKRKFSKSLPQQEQNLNLIYMLKAIFLYIFLIKTKEKKKEEALIFPT